MLDLKVEELRMRCTVDIRNGPDWDDRVLSSALRYRSGEWSLYYFYFRRQHFLGLQLVSDVPPEPFDGSVQVEGYGTGRIASELSQETHCTCDDALVAKESKIYRWRIWSRSVSVIERSDPEFYMDSRLRFLVVIRDGNATSTIKDIKSTSTQAEDIEDCAPVESISYQTEYIKISEADVQSTGTGHPRAQTTLLLKTPTCLEILSEDLYKYMGQGSDTDVEFQCGGKTIAAHSAIVCARSQVIASMLSSDMVEGRTRVVKLPNLELDTFQHFLRYIYTGRLPELTFDLALKLYESGDQYAVIGLTRRCSKYLLEHLSIHNACDVLIVADAHSDGGLVKKVIEYMVETKVPLMCDRWSTFCDHHPRLANKVFNSLMKIVLK